MSLKLPLTPLSIAFEASDFLQTALKASTLFTSVANFHKSQSELDLSDSSFDSSYSQTEQVETINKEREQAIETTQVNYDKVLQNVKNPDDVISDKETRDPIVLLGGGSSILDLLQERNKIENDKLAEAKELTNVQITQNKLLHVANTNTEQILVQLQQLTGVMTVTQPEIAQSTTKQAEVITARKQVEATKASAVSVTNQVDTPTVNVEAPTVNVAAPTVNVDTTEQEKLAKLQAAIYEQTTITDFDGNTVKNDDGTDMLVTKTNVDALLAYNHAKLLEEQRNLVPIIDAKGNAVLDADGAPLLISRNTAETQKAFHQATHSELATLIAKHHTTEQIATNLDGRPITKEDGTAIQVTPMQAKAIKDIALAKNEADEAEFELDDDDIDLLKGPELQLPDFVAHEPDYHESEYLPKLKEAGIID